MALNIVRDKGLKEFKLEIDNECNVQGFLDIIGLNKIKLFGKIKRWASYPLVKKCSLEKCLLPKDIISKWPFPLIIHFKIKRPVEKSKKIEIYDTTSEKRVKKNIEEYMEHFTQDQKFINGYITCKNSRIKGTFYSKSYGKWRIGAYLDNVEIIEAKNVLGLEDVKK